jgi:hypothetical protein
MSLALAKPLPAGTEYLADVVEQLAAKYPVSPYLLLGFLYAESNFGLALKPKGPGGSGDYIARPSNPDRDKRMSAFPLPGVEKKQVDGIKARNITGPVVAWVPTTTGWGCGLWQCDYEAHFDFCKSGAWADALKGGEYVISKILLPNKATLAKQFPALDAVKLGRAMVASYNAGAGRVAQFLKAGKDIDTCTFHTGYIDKIINKADELAGRKGAWLTT